MSEIVIIAHRYPTRLDKNGCTFIQQLAWQFADSGKKCTVINPINEMETVVKGERLPKRELEYTENGECIEVLHPRYLNLGQTRRYFGKTLAPLTVRLFYRAVARCYPWADAAPDAVYAHFIIPAGLAAARLTREFGVKSYLGHGEALFVADEKMGGLERLRNGLNGLTGVIAVSQQNKNYLIDRHLIEPAKIGVFPNGFRSTRFYPVDKAEARKRLGICEDDFIVGYVGRYDYEKGIERLEEAVDQVEGVKFICAGKGELKPKSEKCISSKPVPNEELRYFYSSLDAFVLPTLCEGCCNAIVEAMACGCPIISSDLSFNDDLLFPRNSIRINPENVSEIAAAITHLRDDAEFREALSKGSLEVASGLSLEDRVNNMMDFMAV